jgi:Icc-related predicted phosphoesterase
MKVMVVGDLHGDTRAGVRLIKQAGALNIGAIVQVGDFGYWPHFRDGIQFLDSLNEACRTHGVVLHWLDGNHENFDAIEAAVKHYPKDDHGRVSVRTNIKYCSRGATWTWNSKRFMTVGGAVSIDKETRLSQEKQYNQSRRLWWPQEQLTEEELSFAVARSMVKPIDYLFTHDCPTNAPFAGRVKNDLDSQAHRQKMDRLGKAVKPKLWFHGHMHTKYDGYQFPEYEPHTTVYGLECNPEAMHGYTTWAYWGVLDTDTDEFVYGPDLTETPVA